MKNRENWMVRLADGMDLRDEPMPGRSIVELCGNDRVLIERHGGVVSYGMCEICVRVSYGVVQIHGCGLRLGKMTKEQLVICGRIDRISLTGRDRP